MSGKVWLFDKEKRDSALAKWKQRQIDTGHPKAIEKIDFVCSAIEDFHDTSESLYKETITRDIEPEIKQNIDLTSKQEAEAKKENVSKKTDDYDPNNFSIKSMLDEWNKQDN